jgi:hypothetical protein
METSPFSEKADLILFHDSERLPRISGAHMVVLPQRGSCFGVAESDEHLPTTGALHVNMRRTMLPGRRVDVDAKGPLFMDLDHK